MEKEELQKKKDNLQRPIRATLGKGAQTTEGDSAVACKMGYSGVRNWKDSYNRTRGVERLRKAYASGKITKNKINKRGYSNRRRIDNRETGTDYNLCSFDEEGLCDILFEYYKMKTK